MRKILRILSALLLIAYITDLLLKKMFLADWYGQYALPETADYLLLFFSVGCFLLSIVKIESPAV